jgi:hypothetical protein
LELIKEKREQAGAEVAEVQHDIDMMQGEILQASMGRATFTSSFLAHVSHLESVGNKLINEYREANRRARTTPPPAYFEQPWKLVRSEIPVGSEIDRDQLKAQVEAISVSLTEALTKIHEMHDQTIDAFGRLDVPNPVSTDPSQRIRLVG